MHGLGYELTLLSSSSSYPSSLKEAIVAMDEAKDEVSEEEEDSSYC